MNDWSYFLPQFPEEQWGLAVAVVTAVACSLVGCFLVLRKMSLLGDAVSHAVLPGLAIAFLVSGTLNIGAMMLGALATALVTGWLIELLNRSGSTAQDAHLGVVFTSMFALGVMLIRLYARQADLDSNCVFEGQLAYVGQNLVDFAGLQIPRAMLSIVPALLLNLTAILLCWKELKLATFDPALAKSMGFRPGLLHWLLISLTAFTAVGSFEAVGSILVVSMLIVPAATAQLLTDSMPKMIAAAAGIGALAAYLGWGLSGLWNVEPGGMVALTAGCLFFTVMLFSPRYGVLPSLMRRVQLALRISREDLLGMLYRLEELHVDRRMTAAEVRSGIGGDWTAWLATAQLRRSGAIETQANALTLSESGRRIARGLVRAHRLWEAYLAQKLSLPLDHVHAPAERMEHYLGDRLQGELAAEIEQEDIDPHGRAIPPDQTSPRR